MAKFHFGANLRRIRKQTDISQDALAAKLGITQSTVSKMERTHTLPEDEVIHQIADYLGVAYSHLVPDDADIEEETKRLYSLTLPGMISYRVLLGVAAWDFTRALWDGLELDLWITKIGLASIVALFAIAFLRYTQNRL